MRFARTHFHPVGGSQLGRGSALSYSRSPSGGDSSWAAHSECFGNHVAPGWVLTAAHCFAGMGAPNDGQPDVSAEVTFNLARPGESSVNTTVAPVYFHPAAVKTKALLEWTQGFLVSDLDCAHDLALVRVAGLEGRPVVPLYLPQCAAGKPPDERETSPGHERASQALTGPAALAATQALTADGPPARTGFGVAYSRLADAVFIAGGRLTPSTAPAGDVWRHHQGAWLRAPLSAGRMPVDVRAAAFAARGGRLWLIDLGMGPGNQRRWFLYRIAPVTGEVEVLRELPFLRPYDTVWLGVTEHGDLLLGATHEHAHFVARIRITSTASLTVDGFAFGAGRLLKRPELRYGNVTRAVRRLVAGQKRLLVEHVELQAGPCPLEQDL